MPTTALTRGLHLIAIFCVLAVAAALVSQHVFDMQPCAWCVLQRLIFIVIAFACWLGILLRHPRPGAIVAALLAISGVVAAYYQYTVAANSFSCDMTFADSFMVGSGLDAMFPSVFGIFASCMDARVELLGIEYALWALGLYLVIIGVAVHGFYRSRRAG
jgi:disulfide bond formation protein DsbB